MITWNDLDEIRKDKGFSLKEASRLAGYSENAMGNVINGHTSASPKLWRALCELLGVDAPPPTVVPQRKVHEERAFVPAVTPKDVKSTFEEGKRYVIRENERYNDHVPLKYLRKEGVHHMFCGPGGWLTAWTDAQLVGKKIEEASPAPTRDATKKKPKR
ncbi:MAG: helix-turn-helix transcriptional regulator [Synergistaceae bacterium]|nr:helix-turn-helix transcriptional regulator [Synergistaceae bacterium]